MYEPHERIKNVFLYIRQSTDERSKRQVRSLSDQRTECEALAERLGLNIVEVFREDQSAKRPHNRPVFKSMLKQLSYKSATKRRADGILAWHPDRLSRNALEAGMIVQMLDDEQIKDMFFPAYSFHNDPSGKEHLFIEFARAKGYSDHLSVSVKRGTFGREKEGAMVYPIKFGYQKKREVPGKPALCSLFPIPCPVNFPIVKRIFELRLEGHTFGQIERFIADEGLLPESGIMGKSRIAAIASDPFYYGHWVINKKRSNERIIDMRTISLPSGTKFTPVVTEAHYWQSQSKDNTKRTKNKHINPFPMPVTCHRCAKKMRPCWKKIKRAGGLLEDQLGYECQTKLKDGNRCKQPRLKADILYSHITEALANITMNEASYQRFLAGSERYIKKRIDQVRRQRAAQSRAITKYRTEKLDLLKQKAVLAETGGITSQDKKLIDEQLKALGDKLSQTEEQKLSGEDVQRKAVSFRKYIELSQSLHGKWLTADITQKQKISEKILLNLSIEDRQIHSHTWKSPFGAWLKEDDFLSGTAEGTKLEPRFEVLWRAIERGKEGLSILHKPEW